MDEEATDSGASSGTNNTVVSLSEVNRLIRQQSKTSAIRQAFALKSSQQGAIALQNVRSEIINGLLPLDQIGQRRITIGFSGSMAVLVGGDYRSITEEFVDWSNYINRMTEFLYVSQVFTHLTVTTPTPSRYGSASASNLVNSYFFGGFAGKRTTPNTIGFSAGTDTIDRYNRASKSIVQIATKVSSPWVCFYSSSSLTNLNKAIIPSGQRSHPAPAPWKINFIDLGNRVLQYADNSLKRFGYSGEDMQTIAATLSQPRMGASALQGDKKTGYFFFGLNCYDRNKAGGIGGYDVNTNFNQATQFDLDLETSTVIGEFRSHGGSRFGGGSASSKINGYVFSGRDHTTHTATTREPNLNSIFEFNFSTRAGTVIGTVLPEIPNNPHYLNATASSTDAYIFRGNSGAPNSYIFNFGRRDLAPISTALVTQANVRLQRFAAESDYNVGWGI